MFTKRGCRRKGRGRSVEETICGTNLVARQVKLQLHKHGRIGVQSRKGPDMLMQFRDPEGKNSREETRGGVRSISSCRGKGKVELDRPGSPG